MKKQLQQIVGYSIGGSLVLFVIPYGIYSAAIYFAGSFTVVLLPAETLRVPVIVVLFLLGSIFGIWSIVVQNIVGEGGPVQIGTIEISPKTRNLVVTGPYKYSRNPMLFGACLMYFAFAFFLNSIPAAIAVALFMICMLIFVKLSEEKRLLKDFGESYVEYRKRVSMFIPWSPKKDIPK